MEDHISSNCQRPEVSRSRDSGRGTYDTGYGAYSTPDLFAQFDSMGFTGFPVGNFNPLYVPEATSPVKPSFLSVLNYATGKGIGVNRQPSSKTDHEDSAEAPNGTYLMVHQSM